jgi:hypothetical protein
MAFFPAALPRPAPAAAISDLLLLLLLLCARRWSLCECDPTLHRPKRVKESASAQQVSDMAASSSSLLLSRNVYIQIYIYREREREERI